MEKVIKLEHLSKKFDQTVAVYDYSLSAEQGKIISLLGPNGSGKSTLIRIMTGLMSPCTGQGTCMGYDLIKENAQIRANIGYMPQKFSLYRQLTVFENLLLFAEIRRLSHAKARVEEIICEFELEKYRNHYTTTLSGGWQQRLSLAVSVIHQPKLLILDEPTAGVDPDSRRIIWQQIQKLSKQGMTILVATHYMDEAVKTQLIQFLFYGRLVASGTRQTIISDSQLNTWEVMGDNVRDVMSSLKSKLPALQILEYGDHLRISSIDKNSFPLIKAKADHNYCGVRCVTPSLEDCFVYYSSLYRDDRL